MGKRVQRIGGNTGNQDAFTGLPRELTVDTTKKEIRVHDGLTAGGIPVARADVDNVQAATSVQDGKMTAVQVVSLAQVIADAAQNAIDIATNVANIATNTGDIATNTAAIAAINALIPAVAGVAEINKLLLLGATKNVDTIDIALNGLKIAATAVTKTAAEINDLVDKSSVQTITGVKTMSSPVLNTPDVNNPDLDGGTINGIATRGIRLIGQKQSLGIVNNGTLNTDVLCHMLAVFPEAFNNGATFALVEIELTSDTSAGTVTENILYIRDVAPANSANYERLTVREMYSVSGSPIGRGTALALVKLDGSSNFIWHNRVSAGNGVGSFVTISLLAYFV